MFWRRRGLRPWRPRCWRAPARTHCPNCGAKFDGPYCAHCGQERDTHRRTIGHLLGDFFEDILSFDSRILRTARALVLQPGELSCAFREGRTRAYVPPIRLYFFATLLFFLILSLSGIAIVKLQITAHKLSPAEVTAMQARLKAAKAEVDANVKQANAQLKTSGPDTINFNFEGGNNPKPGDVYPSLTSEFFVPLDTRPQPVSPDVQKSLAFLDTNFAKARKELAAKGQSGGVMDWLLSHGQTAMATVSRDPTAVNGPLTTWIPRALFLLLPLFACLTALFHIRQRKDYYFVDHLVFSVNLHSFAFIVLIGAVWLAQVLSGGTVGWLALGAVGIYLLIAMKRFYGQSWPWTVIKFACVSFIYAFFFLIPALTVVLAISVLQA